MRALEELVRPNIIHLKPFSSARAEYNGTADIFLDANENPFQNGVNRYPDPYQQELKKVISNWRQIPVHNIFLGNGSDEIIDLIVRVFCQPSIDRIRYLHPSFGMYEVAAELNDVHKLPIPLNADFSINVHACIDNQLLIDKVLFLCSPNNPTGNSFNATEIEEVIGRWEGIVVLDEAYIDFSEEVSFIKSLNKFPNLIILQTFSKALGAAGIRIGMAFASSEVVDFLNKVKPPYNIGISAQERALVQLKNIHKIEGQIKEIKVQRDLLISELSHIESVIKVFPSTANFLLVRFNDHLKILQELQHKGIVIRDRSKLPGCENCLRITVGTATENNELLTALKNLAS